MNRIQQNRALKDFAILERLIGELHDRVPATLIRGTFDSGQKRDKPGTTVADVLKGTLEYSDPTGEEAIRQEVADRVGNAIQMMARHVSDALNIAKWVLDGVPKTNEESIRREIPDCAACDLPVFGRVKAGYHPECYAKKQRLGISDRSEFRRVVQAEMSSDSETEEWRIKEIDRLRERNELPAMP